MEQGTLENLLTFLQYGTKLHTGVIFFSEHHNKQLHISYSHAIHDSPLCREFKAGPGGFEACLKCRKCAIQKAINTQRDFGGLCFNGLYEYVRPVISDGKCICVIFIGNIIDDDKSPSLANHHLADTAQRDFDFEKCQSMGAVIEAFVRMSLKNSTANYKINAKGITENIQTYAKNSMQYDIRLSHMADYFHYNEQYLGRLFKKEMKMSFCEYLNRLRVSKASELLADTDAPVIEIASQTGFNNVTYFNRIFKKLTGMTPGDYRTTKRE